jgi:hypothetical protein
MTMNFKFISVNSSFCMLILTPFSHVIVYYMKLGKAVPILALVSVGLLALMPGVAAMPIQPNLSWNHPSIPQGSSNAATFGVSKTLPNGTSDPDCPSGQTFTGTLTVTTPAGKTSTVSETAVPCGTQNLSATYPSGFTAGTGVPSTSALGTYNSTWAGTTSVSNGGAHPTFSVTQSFLVTAFSPPPTVPQFGLPAILVAAMGLVLVAAAKKGHFIKI